MKSKIILTKNFRLKIVVFLILITISHISNSFSQVYWNAIPSPVSKTLTKCFFINPSTGWISGDSGTIIRTTNSGNNWTILNSGTFNNIEDIFFLNERLGWALTYQVFPDSNEFPGTEILTTTNGGNNWLSSMFPDTNMFMKTVYYMDSLRGFLGVFLLLLS